MTPSIETASRPAPAWLLYLAMAAPILAISGQSLWIDEACTLWKAQQPSLAQWWWEMRDERGSDLQMPLYQLFMWAWVKVAGTSEVALRAPNLIWLWMGLIAVWRGLARVPQLALGIVLTAGFSPFAWYYLNDARPYAMQVGTSLTMLAALWRLRDDMAAGRMPTRPWPWILAGGALGLSGSSLIGMIFAGAFLAAGMGAAGWRITCQVIRSNLGLWVATVFLCLVLGLYYWWTLQFGARGTTAGRTDVRNVAFVFYELFGFAGLGPGRVELRSGSVQTFRAYLPLLLGFAAVILMLTTAGLGRSGKWLTRRGMVFWTLFVGGAVCFVFIVGFRSQFRVLGRHFTPLLPLVSLALGAGLMEWLKNRTWGWVWPLAFLALAVVSGLELRFAPRHAKDAYREAAGVARSALDRKEVVWWVAEKRGAQVYAVPFGLSPHPGQALLCVNPARDSLTTLPAPNWILLSKPDLHDLNGAVATYAIEKGYETNAVLPAFVIWKRP